MTTEQGIVLVCCLALFALIVVIGVRYHLAYNRRGVVPGPRPGER